MFNEDRKIIENKYHKINEKFDPYQRMAYHGYEFDKETGLEDEQIIEGLKEMSSELDKLSHPHAKACAVRYALENTKIDISEHDWFVGFWSVNRLANSVTLDKWNKEVFNKLIPQINNKINDLNESGAISLWPDFDHVVPDWESLLELGFSGIIKRAENYREVHKRNGSLTNEAKAFFDGIITEYTAAVDITDRLYRCAEKKNFEKAPYIAQCLKSIRDGAPKNIYEAMQLIYVYFMISECFDSYQVRSLGNGLDHSLYKFYKRDIENGTYTREKIKEFLRYFLMQWSAIGNYWGQPFYMGGTNADGTTKYNDLSYDILDIYDELGIYNPKIQLKINSNIPERLLYKAFDMVRRGHNSIVFCCEPGMMRAVMSYGATYEEALNMDIRGCYETGVRANEVSTGSGYINSVKAVLYALTNGYDNHMGKQIGLKTGSAEELQFFEDFYEAVLKQWGNLIDMTIDCAGEFEKYLSYINPSNLYSGTIEGALKKGTDAYQSGVKFNNSAILNCGFASLVDSVMAVKEFVYDKKLLSLKEMTDAIDNNWRGYEKLQVQILKSPHKYGNNDEVTDMYTEAMSAFFTSRVNNHPNARGGIYKAVMHSAMQFVWQGKKTSATPDGRFMGAELSKNASPVIAMDKNGVTALLNSVLYTRPETYLESHCIDIMLHPSVTNGEAGLKIMKNLLFNYMKNNGQSVQFNVLNAEVLKEAQKNPEKYKNLQIRVCGWNVLWNNLTEAEQNAYITKAENVGC